MSVTPTRRQRDAAPASITVPWWGHPPLTPTQWSAFRDWQQRARKPYAYEPAAIARRKRALLELEAGRVAAIGSETYALGIDHGSLLLRSAPEDEQLAA